MRTTVQAWKALQVEIPKLESRAKKRKIHVHVHGSINLILWLFHKLMWDCAACKHTESVCCLRNALLALRLSCRLLLQFKLPAEIYVFFYTVLKWQLRWTKKTHVLDTSGKLGGSHNVIWKILVIWKCSGSAPCYHCYFIFHYNFTLCLLVIY